VAINSDKKILFNCSKCKHEYYQSPNNKRKGKGCPFCSNQKLCGRLDCEFCLYKSCYDYKDIWSGKNINKDGVYIKPETVAINSNIKYIFKCHICNHNYEQTPSSKTQGCGCPYCSNTFNKLCGSLECAFCLPKSCYIYADTWSDKNKISPLEVSINSRKNYIFNCNVCKEYNQKPSNKTRGCPKCVNKTEGLVAEYLKATNINFTQQYKIGNIRKYYDFYLIDYKLIIEVDGAQHFRQVRNWGNPEENLENDIQKMKVAMTKGISILRIYQPDIWLNKIDWKACINENLYKRTTPDVTTVASNPEIYNNHAV
jgi:very-short-patch-repair endonuclease